MATAMGWNSAPSKIQTINGNIVPHLCPGTETRIDRTGVVLNSTLEVGGGTTAASPIWLGCTPRQGQIEVSSKSTIITEEREGLLTTVGQKPRCCFCQTDLLFPLSSSSLIIGTMLSESCIGTIKWNVTICLLFHLFGQINLGKSYNIAKAGK